MKIKDMLIESKLFTMGLVLLIGIIFLAIFADFIAPYDPIAQDFSPKLPPSPEHPLGTDELGRDVFSRLIYGSRITLYVALISVGFACIIGIPIGLIAGYYGETIDKILNFFIDLMLSFPAIILTILITGMLGHQGLGVRGRGH